MQSEHKNTTIYLSVVKLLDDLHQFATHDVKKKRVEANGMEKK